MILTSKNIEIFAARNYRNEFCISKDEFEEDFKTFLLIKRSVRKILKGKSDNIRLLSNHLISCVNVFHLDAVKQILLFEATKEEREVFKTLFNYFGYLSPTEMAEERFCLRTAKLLKEMDR